MTGFDVFDTIQQLRADNQAFCIATVVRTADLTSAKAGAKAVITQDGRILGQLGGGCVTRALKATAHQVLQTAEAQMISVRPADAAGPGHPDIEVHPSGCPSGGTVDIFIEPHHPPLRLLVIGETPIALAIAAHADLMRFRVDRADSLASESGSGRADVVVIASQGAGDLDGLRAALAGPARYIGVVASHRKADFLRTKLIAEGAEPDRLDAVHSPVGLDLGAIDPHEIAVSILAEIVRWRRSP